MRFAVRQPAASPATISYSYQTSNADRRLMFGKNDWVGADQSVTAGRELSTAKVAIVVYCCQQGAPRSSP